MDLSRVLRRVLTVYEWDVGVADFRLEELVRGDTSAGPVSICPSVRWLRKPWFVRYQADPCLIENEGHLFLYYEEVLFGSVKGRLRQCRLTAEGTLVGRHAMVSLPYHVSYPCVFDYAGRFYFVPEAGDSKRVTLYEAPQPQGPWAERATLLDGANCYDNTLFQFGERWWLFSTVGGADAESVQSNLHIWHAAEPWGPWTPHRRQCAKRDIHSARPAGRPFVVDGMLYRPAQDCRPRYGLRVVINRVLTLTPDEFEEEVCAYIEPDPLGPRPEGLHTLTSARGIVMVDGCRERPSHNPVKVLLAAIPRIRSRLRLVGTRHEG